MALSVAKANEVARQLDREFNGAGDRMLASASRVLVPEATERPRDECGRWLGEGPSSLASGTPNDGPSHPTTEPAA